MNMTPNFEENVLAARFELQKLSPAELAQLTSVARGPFEGGSALTGKLRAKAISMGLAYKSGRLKALVYKELRSTSRPLAKATPPALIPGVVY